MTAYVFPPMDEDVFDAKLARWNAREKKEAPKLGSIYGRPSRKRIPREQFQAHIEAVTRGRFAYKARRRPLTGRSVQP